MALSRFSEFVNVLSARTGLHTDVLYAWVSREQGVNNNVLGLVSNGHLEKFPTQTAGAIATAARLNSLSIYSGIRASYGGTSAQQALAISKSPWHLGPAGVRAAGGIDPYYYKGFVQAGILSASGLPKGGVSTPIAPSPHSPSPSNPQSGNPSPSSSSGTTTLDKLLGLPADLEINVGTIKQITDRISALASSGTITDTQATNLRQTVGLLVPRGSGTGPKLSSLKITTDTGRQQGIVPDIQIPNIDVGAAIQFVAIVLVGIAFLFLGGIVILRNPK